MNNQNTNPVTYEPQRRLSPWRVMLAVLVLAGLGAASVSGAGWLKNEQAAASHKPWFASYVDVTATPRFAFENMGTTEHRDAVLSFVVGMPNQPCVPAWGAAYTLDQAGSSLDLDRRIARLQQQGGAVAVSFGGRDNHELAIDCQDQTQLAAAYQSVIDRYHLDTIDLDIEEPGLGDGAAGSRRAEAIAQVQTKMRASGKKLAVWVTLPATPQGLSEDGTNGIADLLAKNVDITGVNVMTMDYGSSRTPGQSMLEASESALTQTERQLGILYQLAGMHLSDVSLWAKLGATPMIGQNDTTDEVFTLSDAQGLNDFATSHHLSRMSMWSANRDLTCGSNYVDLKMVSSSCSGINQGGTTFASLLGLHFDGTISNSADAITVADTASDLAQTPDDPATSPYQIWTATGAYLQGTKVVWHHNVYQAKWWTQGDMPDNPVLQIWQTPWELIGPVLPGEKPVKQATLPAGTYPNWSGTTVYDAGMRVLFNGVPYQAKWWTQGDSPAAATSNPDGSPWVPLTQAQINAVLNDQGTN